MAKAAPTVRAQNCCLTIPMRTYISSQASSIEAHPTMDLAIGLLGNQTHKQKRSNGGDRKWGPDAFSPQRSPKRFWASALGGAAPLEVRALQRRVLAAQPPKLQENSTAFGSRSEVPRFPRPPVFPTSEPNPNSTLAGGNFGLFCEFSSDETCARESRVRQK